MLSSRRYLSSLSAISQLSILFFLTHTATTEICTLSLHDALPISAPAPELPEVRFAGNAECSPETAQRSEEHTSELQSLRHLVCRVLLEKTNTNTCRTKVVQKLT